MARELWRTILESDNANVPVPDRVKKKQGDIGQEQNQNKDEKDREQQDKFIKFLKLSEKFNFITGIATMSSRMLKFLGVEFTIAAVIRQSQVSTNFISNIFRLLGIVADTLLLPFLPLLGPIAHFITTEVVPFIQNTLSPKIKSIAEFMGGVLDFLFGLAKSWGPFFEGIFVGIEALLGAIAGFFRFVRGWGDNMTNILIGLVTGMIIMRRLFSIFRGLYERWKGIESAQMERGFTGIQHRQDITNALLKNQIAISQGQAVGSVPGVGSVGRTAALGSVLGFGGGLLPVLLGGVLAATLAGIFTRPSDRSVPASGPESGRQTIGADINLSFRNQGDGERHYQVDDVISRNDHTRFAVSLGDA